MPRFQTESSEAWGQFCSDSFYALRLDAAAEHFHVQGEAVELARGIRLTHFTTSPIELSRTARLVTSSPSEDLLVLLQLSGSTKLEQSGRQVELRAGQAAFCDPDTPYVVTTAASEQLVAMVPRREVLGPRLSAADIRLIPVSLGRTPLRIFRALAEEIVSDVGHDDTDGVAVAASELLRSTVRLLTSQPHKISGWSRDTQRRMAQDLLVRNADLSGLTMADVAGQLGVSARHLSSLFEPDDSPAAFLRRERLRRAHADLLDPASAHLSIAEIGARWGYGEPTVFGRAFRSAYGRPPSQVRRNA